MNGKFNDFLQRLQQPAPHTGKFVALLLIAGLLSIAFIQGVLVGFKKIYPWEKIEHLFQTDAVTIPTILPPIAPATPPVLPEKFYSTLLNFDIGWINSHYPLTGLGGSLSVYEDAILAVHEVNGAVWHIDQATDQFHQTSIFLPNNNADKIPVTTDDGSVIFPGRYNNLHVYRDQQGEHMLATYGYYDPNRNCRTLRLSKIHLDENWREPRKPNTAIQSNWKLLFEANPCLLFTGATKHVTGFQEGGALIQSGPAEVLFSTGDMGRDGLDNRLPISTQSDDSDYGRIFSLSLSTGEIQRVAMGLRNPQNIAKDETGNIWATDQGPMGGDEVNLILPDRNYGWPFVTYGADYTSISNDQRSWPHLKDLGHHDNYEKPKYIWTPSVSPSSITYISNFHPHWDGSLLVSTLAASSIIRLTLSGDRIIGEERMFFGERIRDVLSANGRIYFLTDKGLIGYLKPRSPDLKIGDRNRNAYAILKNAGCIDCHSNQSLPALTHIYEEDIASQIDISYSTTLSAHTGIWNSKNLKEFLLNPSSFAPGSTMPKPLIRPSDVDEIIEALRIINSERP